MSSIPDLRQCDQFNPHEGSPTSINRFLNANLPVLLNLLDEQNLFNDSQFHFHPSLESLCLEIILSCLESSPLEIRPSVIIPNSIASLLLFLRLFDSFGF